MPEFWAGDQHVDTDRRLVRGAGETVGLTVLEAAMLDYLFARLGQPVDRDELLEKVWGYRSTVQSRTVDTTLARLRKKLEPNPRRPRFLRSLRGIGIELRGVTAGEVEEEWHVRVDYPQGPALVGRDRDLARLKEHARVRGVIAIVGAAGVGKSALTLALLRARDDGRSSSVFIDCAPCGSSSGLLTTIATHAGLPDPTRPAVISGLSRLKNLVLVLTNIDGLPPPALTIAEEIGSQRCVVVTSCSAPVELPHRLLRLNPLDREASATLLDQLVTRSGYKPSPGAMAASIHCAGGLPLALELFAPVLEILGPEVKKWALEVEGFDRSGSARTLETVLEASWERLDDEARHVLKTCSLFHEAFELDAACAASGRPAAQMVSALARLRDRSLLFGEGGWMRIVGPIRLFALARLVDHTSAQGAIDGFFITEHASLILGDPARTRAYRLDLIGALPRAIPAHRIPLAEIVFFGSAKGGWVLEAEQGFLDLRGRWSGDAEVTVLAMRQELGRTRSSEAQDPVLPIPGDITILSRPELIQLGFSLGRGAVDRTRSKAFLQAMSTRDDPLAVWLRLVAVSQITPSPVARQHLEMLAQLANTHGWSGADGSARALLALCIADEGEVDEALAMVRDLEASQAADGGIFMLRIRVVMLVRAERYEQSQPMLRRLRIAAQRSQLDEAARGAWLMLAVVTWLLGDRPALEGMLSEQESLELGHRQGWADLLTCWVEGVRLDEVKTSLPQIAELIAARVEGADPCEVDKSNLIHRVFAQGLRQGRWPDG